MKKTRNLYHRMIDALFAAREPKAAWISMHDQRPQPGQRIVAEFAQGSLWAGYYQGARQSFVRWMPLP